MAKKSCELCQLEPESDKRGGVGLCENCLDKFTRAIVKKDDDAIAYFVNLDNFPNATEAARKEIIDFMAKLNAKHSQESVEQKYETVQKAYYDNRSKTNTVHYNNASEGGFFDRLYENIGGKIKKWAKWIFIVEAIGAIIAGLVLIINVEEELILHGFLALIFGPVVAFVGSWILYAFGELVEKTAANERNTSNILNILKEDCFKNN
ncbi:MAG: hypothetical protein E7536_05855 [Ruminococcaceae bacterium]|nr:hypothetical protein [Oscillospiraceae bacterium]